MQTEPIALLRSILIGEKITEVKRLSKGEAECLGMDKRPISIKTESGTELIVYASLEQKTAGDLSVYTEGPKHGDNLLFFPAI